MQGRACPPPAPAGVLRLSQGGLGVCGRLHAAGDPSCCRLMRFLADENVSAPRRRAPSRRTPRRDSVAETRPGAPDDDVLNAADADGRILITEDRDFGEMVIRQRLGLRAVILLELDRLANATEADAVANVVSEHAERLAGNLVVVEPGRIRVRPLRP